MPTLRQHLKAAIYLTTPLFLAIFVLPACPAGDPTATIVAKIVQARAYTSSYVVLAKQSFVSSPADLQQAQKLYAFAYANYSAWVAYVVTALQDGRGKNLSNDTDYQKVSSDASMAGNQFTEFVDSKTGSTKAVSVILSSLGALGLQLWNGIKDRQQKDRGTAATNFEQQTKWSPWESITTDAVKPTQAAQPAQSNPTSSQPAQTSQPSQPTQGKKPKQ